MNKEWNVKADRDSEKSGETVGEKEPDRKKGNRFAAGVLTGAAVVLVIAACVWSGGKLLQRSYASGNVSEADVNQKLDRINAIIDNYYLYEDEIDEDALIEGIYSGYTSALGDPYTEYYDEEETRALLESTSGEFSGIGATLTLSSDGSGVTVVNVYKDSPAEKAGLQDGDVLYQVDGRDVSGQDLETVVSWVKGEKGTDVTLSVLRDGETIETVATRDTIEVQTVESKMMENNIGYISVSEFDEVTYDQFSEALSGLGKDIGRGGSHQQQGSFFGGFDMRNSTIVLFPIAGINAFGSKRLKTERCDKTLRSFRHDDRNLRSALYE